MRTTIRTSRIVAAGIAAIALTAGVAACASSSTPPAAGSSSSASSSAAGGSVSGAPAGSGRAVPTSRTGTSTAATSGAAALEGITFVATEVTGAYSMVPGATISLSFDNGNLSARGGCNNMFGQYTVTGDVLNAPQLASTMMACEQTLMAQDMWLSGFLASSPTWTYQDGTLTLTNGTDTMVMTTAPSGAEALEATGWKLDGLISKTPSANTVTAVDPSLTAWIRFNGSEVAYNTSCNGGGGSADVGDDTITFGALRTTMMFCEGASGETELAMNAVLQGTTPYTVKDDPSGALLTIMSADGTSGLQFTADPGVGADAFATGSTSMASGTMSPTPSSTG